MAKWRTNRPGKKGNEKTGKKVRQFSVGGRLKNIAELALKSAKIRRIERMESNMKQGSSIQKFFNDNANIKKSF